MKYRKLRIAWSVAWGVVAVLLLVLWVRSYWWSDVLLFQATSVTAVRATTILGEVALETVDLPSHGIQAQPLKLITDSVEMFDNQDWYAGWRTFGFYVRLSDDFGHVAMFPYSSVVLFTSTLAAVPWLPNRFSLRTLLIATTLVAVGLGVVMWAS